MEFRTIEYMAWAKRQQDLEPAEINLGSSGMEPPTAREAGLEPPPPVDLAGSNAHGHPALRRLGLALGEISGA